MASQNGFHFDLEDWRQLKVFFYLTDVGPDNGPHRYVRGSHTKRPLRHQFTLFVGKTEQQINEAYGTEAVTTMLGSAGTGFIEDPFGFHTATPVRAGRRLVLEISFGVSDVLHRRRYGELVPIRTFPTPLPPVTSPLSPAADAKLSAPQSPDR